MTMMILRPQRFAVVLLLAVAFIGLTAGQVQASPDAGTMQKNTKTCLAAAKSTKATTAKQDKACTKALLGSLVWHCSDGSTLRGVPVKIGGSEKLVGLRVGYPPSVWNSEYTVTDLRTACGGAMQ